MFKMRGNKMNKQQLASKIWESANKMRSKIEANEYKDYILGFIFYKFLSDKEIKFLKENDWTEQDIHDYLNEENDGTVTWIQKSIGYFISYKDLFSTWIDMGSDFDVANVTDALSAFSRLINPSHKKVFDGIFETLQTGLSKLGDTSGARTKAISGLLYLIKDIPMDGKQDYDVLGFIYEYLISNFAANAGKKAGEFYTPHEVSLLMSEIVAEHLKNRDEIKIYDPTSGSGSLLINIGKSVAKYMGTEDRIKYYAQELKENTYNLTRMNLIMRGIIPDNIETRNGDTLKEDWPYFDENDPLGTYEPLYVDAVVSNPPYSQNWDPPEESDPRYKDYGIAPKSKADYAFLLHDLFHVKPDGIMTIVLPHGVLFRGGEEYEIRKNLIENNKIDAIIGLPANIFFGTGIPTIIMVLKHRKEDMNTDVLVIDASKGFEKVGKNNALRACDIKKITDVIKERKTVDKFSKLVSRAEIRENDYNLNIPRYVDSSEKAESWDIYATMFGGIPSSEIDEFSEYWTAFPALKQYLLEELDNSYFKIKSDDIKSSINDCSDVIDFKQNYTNAFSDFAEYLNAQLVEQMLDVTISKEENIISDNIFERLKNILLVDKYKAYQCLSDSWDKISVDLEVIQTEGESAITQVDPNMVVKKKYGKDTEVQEGYIGHIIPFELVQDSYFKEEKAKTAQYENRLSEITSEYQELIDSISEEDKENDDCKFLNEAKDAFVAGEVKKAVKSTAFEENTVLQLKKALKLLTEEKDIKSAIKKSADELHIKTKEKLESLSLDEAKGLLKEKWITPLVDELNNLPNVIISDFIDSLKSKMNKYSSTLFDIDKEIKETETELCSMIDELVGNDADMQGLRAFQALLRGE